MQDDDETDEHDVERADEDMVDDGADVDVEYVEFCMRLVYLIRLHTNCVVYDE